MGIVNFHTWIKERYYTCVRKASEKVKYDHVYFDMNYILHNVILKSKTEEEFIGELYKRLDIILQRFFPTKSVTFAIDGSSPHCKIKLQRERRSRGVGNINMDKLNSLHLTPGTKFMESVDEHVKRYIKLRKHWYKARKVNFYFYSCKEPDEGEVKILRQMLKHDPNETHLVLGNDADLIVMMSALKSVNNIDIVVKREDDYDVVNMSSLITTHYQRFLNKKVDVNSEFRSDFTVISIMMGNDYLPKVLYVTSIETLWKSYADAHQTHGGTLIKDGKFDETFLKEFMFSLVDNLDKKYNRTSIKLDLDNVEHYVKGLLWCYQMYSSGVCPMYDYVFEGKAPTPMDILLYLQGLDTITPLKSDVAPVSLGVYPLMVLPKAAIKLVPEKYHKLMNTKLKHLYAEEECQTCAVIRKGLSTCHKDLIQIRRIGDDDTEVRQNIGTLSKELHKHKKETHTKTFSIDKILKMSCQ